MIRSHRTQTNEAVRCATLLPALAQICSPLALIEVGAAAGLTLLPDVYSYDHAGPPRSRHRPRGADAAVHSDRSGPPARPDPDGCLARWIDLHPLHPADAQDAHWLACLVWPAKGDRDDRLRQALQTARRHQPVVHRGDLVDDLALVADDAPMDATLVVYHSAVLAYVDACRRASFAAAVRDLGAVWLSNEAPGSSGPSSRSRQRLDGTRLCSSAMATRSWPPPTRTEPGSPEQTDSHPAHTETRHE